MTDYKNTSHLSSWLFTAEELINCRTRSNHEAIIHIEEQRRRTAAAAESDGKDGDTPMTGTAAGIASTTTPQILPPQSFAKTEQQQQQSTTNNNNDNDINTQPSSSSSTSTRIPPPPPLPPTYSSATLQQYLTPPEEHALIQFYATKLPTLIGPEAQLNQCQRPSKVMSTAALLLKRFYLSNSVMMYDPKAIMVASAFLASKLEDSNCNIKYIEDGTKTLQSHVATHSIINSEIALINGINFDLLCFHPYSTILAYTNDLRSFKSKNPNGDGTFRRYVTILDDTAEGTNDEGGGGAGGGGGGTVAAVVDGLRRHTVNARDLLGPVFDAARKLVETVLCAKCGDVGLMATPGQIGLAAMYVANRRLMAAAKAKVIKVKEDADKVKIKEEVDTDAPDSGGNGSEVGGSGSGSVKVENVVQIDFEGYIQNRFQEKKDTATIWMRVKEIGEILEKESGWEQDLVLLKGINKKLKGCRVWGAVEGKKKKKKKVKKRKRAEEGGG